MKNNTLWLTVVLLLLGGALCRPARYDQRQDGSTNVHAHLENLIVLFIPSSSGSILDFKVAKDVRQGADDPRVTGKASADDDGSLVATPSGGSKDENVHLTTEPSAPREEPHREDTPLEKSSGAEELDAGSSRSDDANAKAPVAGASAEEVTTPKQTAEEVTTLKNTAEEVTTPKQTAEEEVQQAGNEARQARVNDLVDAGEDNAAKMRDERQRQRRMLDILLSGMSPAD